MIELLNSNIKNRKEYQEISKKLLNIYTQVTKLQGKKGLAISSYMLDYPWIIIHLPEISGKRILDAGGGIGTLQLYLALEGAEVYNCDKRKEIYNSWIVKREKQFNIKINFKEENLKNTNYEDNFFDYIVSCSSLEHNSFEDVKLIFKEMDRILKPGGLIIFTLVAWKKFKVIYPSVRDPIITCYTEKEIKELIENTNLYLFNSGNNFNQIEEIIVDIFNEYSVCKSREFIPLGVIFSKTK